MQKMTNYFLKLKFFKNFYHKKHNTSYPKYTKSQL